MICNEFNANLIAEVKTTHSFKQYASNNNCIKLTFWKTLFIILSSVRSEMQIFTLAISYPSTKMNC